MPGVVYFVHFLSLAAESVSRHNCGPGATHVINIVCGVPPDSSDGCRDGGLGIVLKWIGRGVYTGVLEGLKLAVLGKI